MNEHTAHPDEPTTPRMLIEAVCLVCEGDLAIDGTVWRHTEDLAGLEGTEVHAADPEVALVCPECGHGDIHEVNVAESWEPVEKVVVADGVLTFVVAPPGSGDWEGAGWVCAHCATRLSLPDPGDFDLFFA